MNTLDINVINEALTHLKPSSKNEIEEDLKKARNLPKKEKTNSIKTFLKNLDKQKKKPDYKKVADCLAFDRIICKSLKIIKEDFIPLLQMYNILTNKEKCYKLKKYLIINRDEEDSSTVNTENKESNQIVIMINLEPLYNDKTYYSNIVKGILGMINSNFLPDQLKVYFPHKFFIEDYFYYKNNTTKLKDSLIALIEQINLALNLIELDKNRFISNSTQTEKIEEEKIPESDFNNILIKADLLKDETLLKIYKDAKKNEDIISKIKDLSITKYAKVTVYINEYLKFNSQINTLNDQVENLNKKNKDKDTQINSLNTQISTLNTQIENLNKDKQDKDTQINSLNTQIENLNKDKQDKDTQINSLNTQISTLNAQVENLNNDKKAKEDKISNLSVKVNFMEFFVNSLISRKVIKHCINQILKKYKASISIVSKKIEQNGEKKEIFYIQVIKKINGASIQESQDFVDFLYNKKDEFNVNIHFDGIEKPEFIGDAWDVAINFIKFPEKQKKAFNKIITKDIKDNFKFSQKDLKIKII